MANFQFLNIIQAWNGHKNVKNVKFKIDFVISIKSFGTSENLSQIGWKIRLRPPDPFSQPTVPPSPPPSFLNLLKRDRVIPPNLQLIELVPGKISYLLSISLAASLVMKKGPWKRLWKQRKSSCESDRESNRESNRESGRESNYQSDRESDCANKCESNCELV